MICNRLVSWGLLGKINLDENKNGIFYINGLHGSVLFVVKTLILTVYFL